MTALIQIRRDTVANWAVNPTLNAGEFGYETDTGNMKIGTGVAWNSTAYLDFSMPARVATSDLNANTAPGRYYLLDMLAATNIPTGLIAPIALDGQASLWVQTFKDGPPVTVTNIVQMLFSEGAGTTANPPKSWARSYDVGAAAWRDWYALSSWGVSSTNGVELRAATIVSKDTLVVDGISTLTGAVNVAGVLSVADGNAGSPSITNTGDPDTGLSFATDNQIVLSTGGQTALTIGASQGATVAGNLIVSGTTAMTGGMSGILDMNSARVTELADPTASTDATNRGWVSSGTIFLRFNLSGGSPYSASESTGGNWTATIANVAAISTITLTPAIAGTYHGLMQGYDSSINLNSNVMGVITVADNLVFTATSTPNLTSGILLVSLVRVS